MTDHEHPGGNQRTFLGISPALLESLREGICLAVLVLDPSGRPLALTVLQSNRAFERLTGTPAPAGLRLTDRGLLEAAARCLTGGARVASRLAAGGGARSLELTAVPLGNEPGGPVGLLLDDVGDLRAAMAGEAHVRELLRRLVSVQEEERRRIARDIHDQMGQAMTALRINLESLAVRCGPDAGLAAQAARTRRLAIELDRSLDHVAWQLRPASLDHLGLSAALGQLVRGWSERFGIAAEYRGAGIHGTRLQPDVEANLYRVSQEALHNVYKHARATRVTVVLEIRDHRAVLVVEDDGRGFDPASRPVADSGGLGLLSMRERTILVGGEFEIESAPGRGTTIFVRVPHNDERAGGAHAG